MHSSLRPSSRAGLFAATLAALALAFAHSQAARAQDSQRLTLIGQDVAYVSEAGVHINSNGLLFNSTTNIYEGDTLPAVMMLDASSLTLADGGTFECDPNPAAFGPDPDAVVCHDMSTCTIEGGTVIGAVFCSGPGVTCSVSGGDFQTYHYTFTSGKLSFPETSDGVAVDNGATAHISGGTVPDILTDGGLVTVTGGALGHGGLFYSLFAENGGVISLWSQGGLPFQVTINGVTAPMNDTALPLGSNGTLSGTLLDGEPISVPFDSYQGGVININVGAAPAPEPSQWAGLGIGLLGLAGRGGKARKRAA